MTFHVRQYFEYRCSQVFATDNGTMSQCEATITANTPEDLRTKAAEMGWEVNRWGMREAAADHYCETHSGLHPVPRS